MSQFKAKYIKFDSWSLSVCPFVSQMKFWHLLLKLYVMRIYLQSRKPFFAAKISHI